MALPVWSPFDTILNFALNLNILTLSIDSLSNLVDTYIVDTVITGNSIDNTTISSIFTSRTDPTTTLITPPTTNTSPTLTVEGAPFIAFDDGTVFSVPKGSSQKEMTGMNEISDSGYDSGGNIGHIFDAIAVEYPSLDKALVDNDDPTSNICIPPTSTNNNEVDMDQPNNTNGK